MSPSGLRAVCLAVLLISFAGPIHAQLIPIKTIPIAQGDQFQIFPSDNMGLGGVSIALADSIGDPFSNPATTARLRVSRFFSAPTVYSLSQKTGGGRSLPVAFLARAADWYGGASLIVQQVDPSRTPGQNFNPPTVFGPQAAAQAPIPGPDLRSHPNAYAFGMIGRSWSARRLSVGASVLWTDLHALDGVDLLYSGSIRVKQSGDAIDVRVGALKRWEGERPRTLEAVVVHNRYAATHDVLFVDQFWDPNQQQIVSQLRTDQNLDHTNTWGAQVNYRMPLATPGWTLGWIATVNLAEHPKLPNYEITNVAVIPWDPGRSQAYQLGVGLSHVLGPATFGVDAMYEPIHSHTWADAMAPTATAAGDTIAVGAKTIENQFHFSNAVFRMGVGHDIDLPGAPRGLGLQLGVSLRSINYHLRQTDHVQLEARELHTGWYEWTPTWGLTLRFTDLELRYRGRVTKGAGRPGSQFTGVRVASLNSTDILAAPSGPLSLVNVNTATHQISLSLPIH